MTFLHEANVMHRDFKPGNILVDESCNVKICDFGISRTVPPCGMGSKGQNSMHLRD